MGEREGERERGREGERGDGERERERDHLTFCTNHKLDHTNAAFVPNLLSGQL